MADKSAASTLFSRSHPDLPTNEEIYSWAEELVNLTKKYPQYRRYGTEGGHAAVKWIMEKLKGFGIDQVEEQSFDCQIQQYDDWHLTVENENIPCFFACMR